MHILNSLVLTAFNEILLCVILFIHFKIVFSFEIIVNKSNLENCLA